MKRTFSKMMIGMLSLTIAFSGISCSREKSAEKAAMSPEQSKMLEDYKKSVEESKKVVVVKVNGVNIALKDLIDMMNQIAPRYIKDAGQRSPEADAKVKKEALDTLVFRELAFQEAIKQGMKVKPEDVDAAMKKLKTELGSESAYKDYLEKSGFTEALLRQQVERDQLIEMMTNKEILLKAKVDEKLVRDTYRKKKGNFVAPESFLVEDVFIRTAKKDDAVAMNKAKETLSLIRKNNNDISKLAQDKTLLVRNGNVTKEEYPNIFQTAEIMKAGDLSNVIIESDGLHIIKLLQKEPSRQLSFEEARVDIERELTLPVMNKRKQQWENEMKKNARIEIMNTQDVMPVPGNMGQN